MLIFKRSRAMGGENLRQTTRNGDVFYETVQGVARQKKEEQDGSGRKTAGFTGELSYWSLHRF
jgi:hypothetical protein